MFGGQPFGGQAFGGGTGIGINPAIASVLRISPNALVAITGIGFGAGAVVKLGASYATNVTVVNGTRITCTVPSTTSLALTIINTDASYATFTVPTPIVSITTHVGELDATGLVASSVSVVSQADLSFGYQRLDRGGNGRYLSFRIRHDALGQRLRVDGLELPFAVIGRRATPTVISTTSPALTVTMSVGSLDSNGFVFAENVTTASANLTQGYQRLGRPGVGRYLSFRLQHSGVGQRVRIEGLEVPFADIGRRDR